MGVVVHIDRARPQIDHSIKCQSCGHEWDETVPENTAKFECPGCHTLVNECGTHISAHVCETCKRPFTVVPAISEDKLKDWENCLADDCASYDPNRDASYLFEN